MRYILTEEHSVDSLYIDDYNTFKQALTNKYGEPLLDNEKWTSDSKKSFYADDKGRALNYGYLSYYEDRDTLSGAKAAVRKKGKKPKACEKCSFSQAIQDEINKL